jgi:uncharacterized protein YjbI with pentapeptide repeats
MHQALTLWGYEISAATAVSIMAAYIVVSAIAVIAIPWAAIRPPTDNGLDSQAKLVELRSKVRQAVIQFIGGVTVVAAFVVTLQQIRQTEDAFKEKKADLFAKSLATLLDGKSQLNNRAEAMYLLSYVARSDPTYHRSVFDALSNHAVSLSPAACKEAFNKKASFRKEPQIQIAMRILGERNPNHDPTGKRFNVEHACLVEIDLRDEGGVVIGLRRTRLSNATMLRSDFTNADLSGTEMRGIDASDYLNPNWSPEIGFSLHRGEKGDTRGASDYANGYVRRQFVTHFIDTDLTDANFEGAGLAGADFSGAVLSGTVLRNANISRANFNGAQKLTAEQLKGACVGNARMSKEELVKQQPYLWDALRKSIGKDGIPACL